MASRKQIKCKESKSKKPSEDTSKLIRENMKCPVCMEVLLPPIYQCETGHNICYLCIDEVSECPLCKGDYGDTRNYFAEELVNSMSFACKFEDYGCTKTLLGSELKDHQEICEFQPYRCPELACLEVCGLHQMGKHLDRHGFKILNGDVQEASIDIQDDHFDRKTEYNPWRITALNREFYTVSTRQKDGSWYFWTYCLGLPKDTKKFSSEITVFGNGKQCLFRGLVHSLRNQPAEIMDHGNCLILTDCVVKSMRQNGKLKSRVRFIQGKNWEVKAVKSKAEAKKSSQLEFKDPKKNPQKGKDKVLATNSSTVPNNPRTGSATVSPKIPSISTSFTPTSPLQRPSSARRAPLPTSPVSVPRKAVPLRALSSNSKTVLKKNGVDSIAAALNSKTLNPKNGSTGIGKVTDEEQNFVQKMRETLRCPGCSEIISPPVYQCAIGHNCCSKCKMSRSDCAVCRAPIGQGRNFFAEELLYKVYAKCTYQPLGCGVCLPSTQMKLHEKTCDFAPFECPFPSCRTLVGSGELLQHLKSHQIEVSNDKIMDQIEVPKTYPFSAVCALPHILVKNNAGFFPVVVRNPDGSWNFSVTTQEYKNYKFEISVTKGNKTFAYQGPVVSLRMNQTEVDRNGMAMTLTGSLVKSLKNNDMLSYSIKVFQNSDKIKPEDSLFGVKNGPGSPSVQTELFANKRTSVTPKDEDDSSDDEEENSNLREEDSGTQLSEMYDDDDEEEDADVGSDMDLEIDPKELELNDKQLEETLNKIIMQEKKSEEILELANRSDFDEKVEINDKELEKELAEYAALLSKSEDDLSIGVGKVKSMLIFGQEFSPSPTQKQENSLQESNLQELEKIIGSLSSKHENLDFQDSVKSTQSNWMLHESTKYSDEISKSFKGVIIGPPKQTSKKGVQVDILNIKETIQESSNGSFQSNESFPEVMQGINKNEKAIQTRGHNFETIKKFQQVNLQDAKNFADKPLLKSTKPVKKTLTKPQDSTQNLIKHKRTQSDLDFVHLGVEGSGIGLVLPIEEENLKKTIARQNQMVLKTKKTTKKEKERSERKSRSKVKRNAKNNERLMTASSTNFRSYNENPCNNKKENQMGSESVVALIPSNNVIAVGKKSKKDITALEKFGPSEIILIEFCPTSSSNEQKYGSNCYDNLDNAFSPRAVEELQQSVQVGESLINFQNLKPVEQKSESVGSFLSTSVHLLNEGVTDMSEKVADILNEGVEDMTEVVLDGIQIIKDGVNLMNLLASGSEVEQNECAK